MLKRLGLILGLVIGIVLRPLAQITKEFKVEERAGYNLVSLDFNVYKGMTEIKRAMKGDPVYIHTELSKINILPLFSQEIRDDVMYANLVHRNVESENLGKSLSYKLLPNSNDDFDHKWDVGLSSSYLYHLNFYFGIGKAIIDLANLPVSNCFIKSTSADVVLNYGKKHANSVKMDTLQVSIQMGNLDAHDLNLTNAKYMLFESNYGSLNISFGGKTLDASTIDTVVGMGKVNIELPDDNQPFIVKIKSTPMCRTYIPKKLKNLGDKVYASKSYVEGVENLLTFNIDVSVGSVTLK